MSTAIKARSLVKRFREFTAVNDISFDIEEGECFGFLGPNGAGKTTTVRMVQCVSSITSGNITVFGETAGVDNRAIRKMTGVIPQEITLDPGLTVRENLMVFAMFFDISRVEARSRVDEILAFVELTDRRNARIGTLSGGMKRRLQIARALLNRPRLIIADEPTTGLDPQARHLIWQRLRQLKNKGATILLTTQYMEEAAQLCDRLVVLNEGTVFVAGEPRRLIDEKIGREVVEVRVPEEEDARLLKAVGICACGHERAGDTLYFYCSDGRELLRRLLDLGLENVLSRPATLEDVFLKMTGRGLIE